MNLTRPPSPFAVEIDATSATDSVIVMRRTFDAPRELVWATLTDPKHVVRWYGGHGFSTPRCEMDVRPGGRWSMLMRTPDGAEHPIELIYVEVVKPEKLVWKSAVSTGGPHDNLSTVTLEAVGTQTRWTLVTRFQSFADREAAGRIGFTVVLSQGLEKFDALLKTLQPA